MNWAGQLELSYYKEVAQINRRHGVRLVQHIETGKFYVKKSMSVYNRQIYQYLKDHPIKGVPRIQLAVTDEEGMTVIEEYINGRTLAEIIRRNPDLSREKMLEYTDSLCDILIYLHTCTPPIIHRDIKPENIIMSNEGQMYLIDFNAAKYADKEKRQDTALLGTRGYAAPEQYGFGPSVTRTDIYAVGMVISRMIGDRRDIPRPLRELVKNCTKMDPRQRYRDAWRLKEALSLCREKLEKENIRRIQKRLAEVNFDAKAVFAEDNASLQAYSGNESLPVPAARESFRVRLANIKAGRTFYDRLPPGFRSKKAKNMVIASLYYGFWVYASFFNTDTSAGSSVQEFFLSICMFSMGIIPVIYYCDYMYIQYLLLGRKLCRNKRVVNIFGPVFCAAVFFALTIFLRFCTVISDKILSFL